MSTHAKRSPSGASGWLNCAGWQSDSKGSKYADEGTDAHELAALCLESGSDAKAYLGRVMGEGHEVTTDMAEAVQRYVNYVRDVVVATNGALLIEQRLPITSITGEPDAHGTSDVVILADNELIIADLKFGMGVKVDAEQNDQLRIYALAAMEEFSMVGDFTQVRMVIHQPRIGHVSEWTQTVDELLEFKAYVARRIAGNDAEPSMRNPGDKQCRWCSAKATCSALAAKVQQVVGADFDDMTSPSEPGTLPDDDLAEKMAAADLIEQWLKAVRAEVEARLFAGVPVRGFKLVQGKRGSRAWANAEEAEALLKSMRVPHDQMYDYKVVSPTTAEKLHKAEVIGPRQWPKVVALITQSEGRPSVAPESDKRPALVITATTDDFTDESAACDLV